MNIKQSRNIARIVLLVAFCVFVFAWEWKELSERGKSLEQSALVVAPALWIIDDKGPVEYLKISCQLHKYKKVTIFDFLNKPFLEIEGPELSLTDKLLGKIGLLPSIAIEADIEYEGEKIGHIVAIHRHKSIYIHLYVLLTFILIISTLRHIDVSLGHPLADILHRGLLRWYHALNRLFLHKPRSNSLFGRRDRLEEETKLREFCLQ